MKKLSFILFIVSSFLVRSLYADPFIENNDNQPIFTIAILSDLHNQEELISGDIENVRLRGVISNVIKKIKEKENVDLLVLNGDYTSDASIPEANWIKVRNLIHDVSLEAFQENTEKKPVLFINGNHEYEVGKEDWNENGSANYNAGDYYTFPMKTNVGELNENECFYEKTEDSKFNLLAAFHYVINGFDFVCLNTGKFFYTNAWDYQYSIESVTWCKNKLEEIYKDDPDKTVFFMAHLPFADSRSIHASGSKGLHDVESTRLLKSVLAKHKNLIYLYGHDHGGDNAYIRTETAQRVTQYDSNGNVYSDADFDDSGTSFCIQDIGDKYLGYGDSNLNLLEYENTCTITGSDDRFNIKVSGGDQPYIYFSTSSQTFSCNQEAKDILLYEIVPTKSEEEFCAIQTSSIEDGKQYLIVSQNDDQYYALTNETNGQSGGDRRLKSVSLSVDGSNACYSDTDADDDYSAVWTITEKKRERGVKSFCSSFVGSMRYYNNSIDEYVSVNNSRIVQYLMVYVYKDRVVLQMKNAGESGTIEGITIKEKPEPFISERTVSNSEVRYEFIIASVNEVEGTVKSNIETGFLKENTKVIVTAQPQDNFLFEKWTDSEGNLLSTENPYTFSLTANTTIHAQFNEIQGETLYYDFTIIPTNEIIGLVSSKPEPGHWAEETVVSVTAKPNNGFVFEKWTNGKNETLSTENPYMFTLTESNSIIYANFKAKVYHNFTIIPPNEIIGSVSSEPEPGRWAEQTVVSVAAEPNEGFVFEKWTNGLNETLSVQNPYTFNLTETNAVIYANFKKSEIDTGVDLPVLESSSVYVTNRMLYVKNICVGTKITIMDISGRIISTNISKDDYIRIPLLEKQLYIVKVSYSGIERVFKVI